MGVTFTLYLLIAAWQDLKIRKIPVWLYVLFGAAGILENILWENVLWGEAVLALLPGAFLLLVTRCSRGAVGAGDGWFFVASSVYLGFWNTAALLLYGLMFCSAFCLGMVVWGAASGISVRKRRLPFLPFLLPAWFCMTLL